MGSDLKEPRQPVEEEAGLGWRPLAPGGSCMDTLHSPGRTAHTCFHLSLFWSHYRTHSLSRVLRTVAVGVAPLTSYQGHLQVGTVAAAQLHALITCAHSEFLSATTGPVVGAERAQPEAGDTKTGRVGHMSIPDPRPNGLQVGTYSHWVCLVVVLTLSQGSHTSLLEIQAAVHIPQRTFRGWGWGSAHAGWVQAVPVNTHTP